MSITFHWMQRNHWPCDEIGLVEMAKALEDANIESVLLPYGPGGEDFSMFLPDIFRATKKIKMMIALGAYAITPEYALKTFNTAQRFGPNRLDLNLIAGRYNEHFEKLAIDYYPGDSSSIDSHEKRVAMTEKWMQKFNELIKNSPYQAKLAVVGSSDTTIDIANNYTDYIIINGWMFTGDYMDKITNSEPILVLDPLIIEPGQSESDVRYHDYEFSKRYEHPIKGTIEEVSDEINKICQGFNIKHVMIHTDQVDITNLLKLIKYMTKDNN